MRGACALRRLGVLASSRNVSTAGWPGYPWEEEAQSVMLFELLTSRPPPSLFNVPPSRPLPPPPSFCSPCLPPG